MQTEQNAKQQIVEKIKSSTNILVTVGKNPSVDALSAALSLTLMLNRLDKHATAVFSGQVPPAIGFLEPDKTFENSVDSLRDFIIALDKEKADRLRYKVENDVLRIFITPYKTVLSESDLKFSQGDFNVELIIALGVEQREDLDTAVTAHGRILHDATVMTINTTDGETSLGSVDWMDTSASSLCEMLMSLSEALQSGLLDQQIATAVLTGIVASTDRFRNEHTSPKVMTMAAQLMAAGANQQLIAAKLEEGHELGAVPVPATSSTDSTTNLVEGESQKVAAPKPDGELEIAHTPTPDAEPLPDAGTEALQEAEKELAESLQTTAPAAPTLSVDDLQKDLDAAAKDLEAPALEPVIPAPQPDSPQIIKQEHRTWQTDETAEQPTFGGTLNATASDAEEEKRREEQMSTNRQILSHDGSAPETPVVPDVPAPVVLDAPVPEAPAAVVPESAPAAEQPIESTSDEALSFEPAPVPAPPASFPTLADIDEQTRGKAAEDARVAIDAALASMPFDPAGKPLDSAGAVPALSLEHDSPQVSDQSVPAPVGEPSAFTEPIPVEPQPASAVPMPPSLPPLPDFSTLPPLPGEEVTPAPTQDSASPDSTLPNDPSFPVQPSSEPTQPAPNDPGQFKIPGQP